LIRAGCRGNIVNGKRVYPSEANIEQELQRSRDEAKAVTATDDGTVLKPKVVDKNGNVLDDAAQLKMAEANWAKLVASGKCEKAAQHYIANHDLTETCGNGRRGPGTSCPQQAALASDVSTIAMCAVSPDDPDHGPKRRAIRSDPMAVAETMAQGKQR
jgi:hypothetical protein